MLMTASFTAQLIPMDDHLALQSHFNLISSWCNKWQITLHSNKCKVISFRHKRIISNFSYLIDSTVLFQASSYKHLDIHITHDLSWATHVNAICAKASRTLQYLRRNLRNSPNNVRKLAFLTLMRPQLEYAASTWSPYQNYLINLQESVKSRAARLITRNYSPISSVTQIKLDISREPLYIRRSIALLCLFHKYRHCTMQPVLPLEAPSHISRRKHNQYSIKRIHARTQAFNSSTLPCATVVWNDLPDNIAAICNHHSFHDHLHKYFQVTSRR